MPIERMAGAIPWLPQEKFNVPTTRYLGFNLQRPPFDNLLVRQAFAMAIDHQKMSDLAVSNGNQTARSASTFTPPEILGRDLAGQIGILYNPAKALELLAKAGYPNGQGLPGVTLAAVKAGTNDQAANAVAAMLRSNLNVNVNVQLVEGGLGSYLSLMASTNAPGMYVIGWAADYNDPDDFLKGVFYSKSPDNQSHFSDPQYDRLVEQAASSTSPASRQVLYIQAERVLLEDKVVAVPLYYYITR